MSDLDRSVSRAYTGVDGGDNTIPGIVVIRRDGTIVFRQIAQEKDDRLDSAQLLAVIDRTLGTTGRSAAGGYAALSRMQLGMEATTAVDEDARASYGGSVRFVVPIARYAFAGLAAGITTDHLFDGSVLAGARLPFLGDTAAVQVTALGGVASTTPYAGGRLGLWFAWKPTWGLHLDAGVTTERELTITFGVARLISWR